MQLVNKLSAKDILGPVIDVVKAMEIGTKQEAYAVVGVCTAYETGISTFGEWVRFVGDFQGTNYISGEIYRSEKAHIPQVLQSVLLSGIQETAEIESSKSTKTSTFFKLAESIEFAFKVSIERKKDNEDGSIAYEYKTEPLTKIATNDSLSHLTKLLQAPKSGEEEAAKPEETPKPEKKAAGEKIPVSGKDKKAGKKAAA